MKLFLIVVLLIGCLMWSAPSVQATLYRWIDSNGEIHYATEPPNFPVDSLEEKRGGVWQPYSSATTSSSVTPTKISVPYIKNGNAMILEVTLNKKSPIRLMMDTGASYTIISPLTANRLGVAIPPDAPRVEVQTANGTIKVPLVNLEMVQLGSISMPNVTVGIHYVGLSGNVVGLLGMNFFKRFTVTVDPIQRKLNLELLAPPSVYESRNCAEGMKWFLKGQKLQDASQQEAEYYQQAISLCDDIIAAFYALGEIYYNQKDYAKGVNTFLQAVQQYPHNAHAHYMLGIFYAWDDKFMQARQEFQKTLQLDPNHEEAQKWLTEMSGKAYQRRGK